MNRPFWINRLYDGSRNHKALGASHNQMCSALRAALMADCAIGGQLSTSIHGE